MRTLHLFAGAGGGLYADAILGHTPVCAVEIEPYACKILRQQKAEWWPECEVWEGDVRGFDPKDWQGRVDCIHAGFPCQDISCAGGGAGIDGERSGLWTEVVRCIRHIRPRFAFLENVPAITSRGLDRVLGDLAALGMDARWCVLSAADVGAPHLRKRWWCLAYPMRRRCDGGQDNQQGQRLPDEPQCLRAGLDTDADGTRQQPSQGPSSSGERSRSRDNARGMGQDVRDTMPQGLSRRGSESRREDRRDARREPAATSWWDVEPSVGRVAHGVANRVNRIKGLGNAQVPLCAAVAFTHLMGRVNG